jgi:single-strand DNA-binding protein
MFNHVYLVGRLTRDVVLRKTSDGLSVANITIAINRISKSPKAISDFFEITLWRQSAEFAGANAKKGQVVGIEGYLKTRQIETTNGRYLVVPEVVVNSFRILSSRVSNSNDGSDISQVPSYDTPTSLSDDVDTSIDGSSDSYTPNTDDDLPF